MKKQYFQVELPGVDHDLGWNQKIFIQNIKQTIMWMSRKN